MKTEAKATITVNAPIEKVWELIVNAANYPKWNPFIIRVETEGDVTQPGTQIKFYVKFANGKQATSPELVVEAKPPHDDGSGVKRALWSYRFNGIMYKLGLLQTIRYHCLEQQPNGPTTYYTNIEFKGLLRNFVPLADVQESFERQLNATAAYFSFPK